MVPGYQQFSTVLVKLVAVALPATAAMCHPLVLDNFPPLCTIGWCW